MTSPCSAFASATPSADFPVAVGPTTATTRGECRAVAAGSVTVPCNQSRAMWHCPSKLLGNATLLRAGPRAMPHCSGWGGCLAFDDVVERDRRVGEVEDARGVGAERTDRSRGESHRAVKGRALLHRRHG